ncbi:MAG: hypothetical protein HQL80_10765 [Magnetococcales bacterium]|nr:hypothetical protein [Magnetococcales bacterium]
MGAQQVFEMLRDAGLTLFLLEGDIIRATPPEAITDEARAMIKASKTALVELLRQGAVNDRETTLAVPDDTQGCTKADTSTLDGDDYCERVAIIEYDGGIPRQWAEGLAAICTMQRPPDIDPRRWLAIVNAAALFADRWAATAAELGWTTGEVFGIHSINPKGRFDRMGLLMRLADPGKALVQLTSDLAIFEAGRMRARQTLHRNMIFSNEQRLLWENCHNE